MIVKPWGFDIDVEVDIDEGEPPTLHHPGAEPYCVILSAKVGGVEIYEMLDNAQLIRLEQAVMRACNL